jgi:CRISPR/Cas system-associated exonuclease Cas4 (RecB family)
MIKEILTTHVNATRRVFAGGRSRSVGGSEIGQCARKVWWIKHNAPRDPGYVDSWGAVVRGSIFEDHFWYPALQRHFGANLVFAGPNQKTLKSGFLSATPDAIVINQPRNALAATGVPDIGPGCCFVAEAKTIDPRAGKDKAKPEHVFQVNVQLGLIRELTPYQPDHALISYTDASYWDDVKEFPIKFDPGVFDNAKTRARKIMEADSANDLPPEGWIAGGRECEYCPFSSVCGRARTAVPSRGKEPRPEFVTEAVGLARELKACEATAEEADTKVRAARLALTDRMRAENVTNIKADGVSISWSQVRGRQSFDNSGIRETAIAAGIDISRFETTGEPSDRLVIRL